MLGNGEGGGGGGGEAAESNNLTSIMAAGGNHVGSGGEDDKSSGELFESGGGGGGNRWPREETLALLKIRSDMDAAFRDSSLKGPLWEEISRKMAELGYHRSGKKCKEKFENVYKYHKRTKEGRVGKSEGKTYRFFDQLEALDHLHHPHHHPLLPAPPRAPPQGPPVQAAVPITMVMPPGSTVTSSPEPISVVHVSHHPSPHQNVAPPPPPPQQKPVVGPGPGAGAIQMEQSPSATPSSSSSTSSDEELMGRRKSRKRKWKDFFEKLMKDVIDKQEVLQRKFLEAVEKREHDRMVREEAWKMQEIARLNREHEILVQERSMAAAKDAALVSFLQKLSEQQQIPLQLPTQLQTTPPPPQQQPPQKPPQQPPQQPPQIVQQNPTPTPTPQPLPKPQPLTQLPPQPTTQIQTQPQAQAQTQIVVHKGVHDNGGEMVSSSRWPKAEVQALINLRTSMDQKYQENGPKGPLWEEISGEMKKLGYNRNAKRCKEKWENINKYFKKVKESNKKRPEDSKTCPYFHQLDALYREKHTTPTPNKPPQPQDPTTNANAASIVTSSYGHPSNNVNAANLVTPPPPQAQWTGGHSDSGDDDGDEEEDDDDQGSGGYEIVANNNNNNNNNNNSHVNVNVTAE